VRILVVDDEKDINDLVSKRLKREGYEVLSAFDGEEAVKIIKGNQPNLVILDLMLPGIDGLEVCRWIRSKREYATLPILMLTARAEEVERILGLELGADDYITKPFSIRELISRVGVAIRRLRIFQQNPDRQEPFVCRDLFIDFEKYDFKVGSRKIEMSPIEARLLIFLAKNAGRVYSRDQLLDQVWGDEVFVTPRSVDVHISRLRKIVEKDPENPEYIITVRNIGYKFDDSTK
jgi:two-component system alkaline phosphatase synthesis response regulator PhoP